MSIQKSDIAEAVAANTPSAPGAGLAGQMMETYGQTLAIGAQVCIRTVTIACIGKVVRFSQLGPNVFIHLDNYVWVADFGEYKEALRSGKLQKAEELPGIIPVAVAPIVDIHPWNHPLKTTKF